MERTPPSAGRIGGEEARALRHDCAVSNALAPDVAIAPMAHAIERRAVALRKMHCDAVR